MSLLPAFGGLHVGEIEEPGSPPRSPFQQRRREGLDSEESDSEEPDPNESLVEHTLDQLVFDASMHMADEHAKTPLGAGGGDAAFRDRFFTEIFPLFFDVTTSTSPEQWQYGFHKMVHAIQVDSVAPMDVDFGARQTRKNGKPGKQIKQIKQRRASTAEATSSLKIHQEPSIETNQPSDSLPIRERIPLLPQTLPAATAAPAPISVPPTAAAKTTRRALLKNLAGAATVLAAAGAVYSNRGEIADFSRKCAAVVGMMRQNVRDVFGDQLLTAEANAKALAVVASASAGTEIATCQAALSVSKQRIGEQAAQLAAALTAASMLQAQQARDFAALEAYSGGMSHSADRLAAEEQRLKSTMAELEAANAHAEHLASVQEHSEAEKHALEQALEELERSQTDKADMTAKLAEQQALIESLREKIAAHDAEADAAAAAPVPAEAPAAAAMPLPRTQRDQCLETCLEQLQEPDGVSPEKVPELRPLLDRLWDFLKNWAGFGLGLVMSFVTQTIGMYKSMLASCCSSLASFRFADCHLLIESVFTVGATLGCFFPATAGAASLASKAGRLTVQATQAFATSVAVDVGTAFVGRMFSAPSLQNGYVRRGTKAVLGGLITAGLHPRWVSACMLAGWAARPPKESTAPFHRRAATLATHGGLQLLKTTLESSFTGYPGRMAGAGLQVAQVVLAYRVARGHVRAAPAGPGDLPVSYEDKLKAIRLLQKDELMDGLGSMQFVAWFHKYFPGRDLESVNAFRAELLKTYQ